jgi:superfamily II DNA/RNA helicase
MSYSFTFFFNGDGRNPIQSFKDLGIHSWLDRQCTLLSYKKPTEVQVNCIPRILSGHFELTNILVESAGFAK